MATFRPGDQPRTRSIAPAQSAPQPTKIDTKEPAQGGEKSPAETPTYTPNVRGADISLLNTLNNILFVEGTNGGMSNEVAYIRYWKRGGTTGRTEVRSDSQLLGPLGNVPPEVAQQAWNPTKINLLGVRGSTTQNIDWSVSENYWEKGPSFIKTTSGTVVSSTDITTPPSQIPAPPAETNPLSNLPSIPQNNYVNQFPTRVIRPKPTKFERIIYGRSFSANPSGITLTAEPTAQIEDAVWQFLFNPEELQLESGPDYNRAETWGVSDPANSGQPLSWRNNKNRKLTFSKVILHGYTFGKRVEKLEEGLQQLFMARDGENGADGPPVLEFVWGRRFFGPCVIQNIRVREQAWDKGILVNAEVSFELEQVPEWTINDGEVDVARPGRQPLINDPTLPGREQQEAAASSAAGAGSDSGAGAGSGSQEPPKDKPGGGTPAPASNPQNNPEFCKYGLNQSRVFQAVFNQADKYLSREGSILRLDYIRYLSRNEIRRDIERIKEDFKRAKKDLYASSRVLGNYVDKRVANGCRNASYNKTIEEIVQDARARNVLFEDRLIAWIHGCSRETKVAIDLWAKTEQPCKSSRQQSQTAASREEKLKKCQSLVDGKLCGSGLVTDSSCKSVNGFAVKCIGGKWVRI